MNITEVRITLRNEEKLKAFASITFDDCFVVRGLKVINGSQGYFVSMPSRKRKDGSYQDIAHPINNEMRKEIEDKVLDAFEKDLNNQEDTSDGHDDAVSDTGGENVSEEASTSFEPELSDQVE